MSEDQHIRDEGTGYKYFTIVPNMDIDDLPPLELALLVHYRRICGPHGGTVTESLRETAEKTQMSKSQVARVRDALAERGRIAVIQDPDNPRAPVTVRVLDRWGENMARYSAASPPPSAPAAQQPPANEAKSSSVPEVDTGKNVSPSGTGLSLVGTGCPTQGQGCPSQGHAPLYKELKKTDQKNDQEPAAVVTGDSTVAIGAGGGNAPKAAAAAAEDKKSHKVGKDSQKGTGGHSGKAQPARTGTKAPKNAGGNERRNSAPKHIGDVLGQLAQEAAGLDGVDASRALAAYAENIGELTPIVAQKVRDAVGEHGEGEVLEAISEAVLHNVRKWRYVEAILRRKAGQPKASAMGLRAKAIAWAREQGEEVADSVGGRELWAALLAAAEYDPRFMPQEFWALKAAAGR